MSEASPKNVSRSCILCLKTTVSGYICWFRYGLFPRFPQSRAAWLTPFADLQMRGTGTNTITQLPVPVISRQTASFLLGRPSLRYQSRAYQSYTDYASSATC